MSLESMFEYAKTCRIPFYFSQHLYPFISVMGLGQCHDRGNSTPILITPPKPPIHSGGFLFESFYAYSKNCVIFVGASQ